VGGKAGKFPTINYGGGELVIESLSPVVKVLEKEYSDEFVNGLLLTSYLPKERKSSLERLLIKCSRFPSRLSNSRSRRLSH
jgi:hypothetical protein